MGIQILEERNTLPSKRTRHVRVDPYKRQLPQKRKRR